MVRSGASYDQVVESVQSSLPRTHSYFLVDTLEYLQKGGRIGKASAFVGSLLNIKPLLMIKDGGGTSVGACPYQGAGPASAGGYCKRSCSVKVPFHHIQHHARRRGILQGAAQKTLVPNDRICHVQVRPRGRHIPWSRSIGCRTDVILLAGSPSFMVPLALR